MIRFLLKRGWVDASRPGSRHTLLRFENRVVAIPRHPTLKTGTVAAILRQARVPVDEAVRDL